MYRSKLLYGVSIAALLLATGPSHAQNQFSTPSGTNVLVPGTALLVPKQGSVGTGNQPQFVPPSSTDPLPISCPDGTTSCFGSISASSYTSGVVEISMTGQTSTSLVAAPTTGLRNWITACTFSNAHASQGTDMLLQDGSGGTTLWVIPAAALYGGAHIIFPLPGLRQPTTATALFVKNVTSGASTKASCVGYTGS